MKKYQAVIIIVGVILSMTFAVQASGNEEKQIRERFISVDVYRVGVTEYDGFLINPSIDLLETISYRINPLSAGNVGGFPITSRLVDFANNKENMLEEFLNENGVIGEIEKVVVLEVRSLFLTIWITVNGENYFITADENKMEDYLLPNRDGYNYRLYTHAGYYEKFKIKDGILKINGKDITDENYIKFQHRTIWLPLRAVLEDLGVKVEWNAERNDVLLTFTTGEYILNLNDFTLHKVGSEISNLIFTPPGGYYRAMIIDGRTIVNDGLITEFLMIAGAEITDIDYDELVVNVSSQ